MPGRAAEGLSLASGAQFGTAGAGVAKCLALKERSYLGKLVEVRGTLSEYRGKPQMEITSLKSLKIIEKAPAIFP